MPSVAKCHLDFDVCEGHNLVKRAGDEHDAIVATLHALLRERVAERAPRHNNLSHRKTGNR